MKNSISILTLMILAIVFLGFSLSQDPQENEKQAV
jgi:hypothetical protein